jgi:hypothetical protein
MAWGQHSAPRVFWRVAPAGVAPSGDLRGPTACCGAWQRTDSRVALEDYQPAQDELVEARNRLARAIAGGAMSGMTQAEIVDLTGYTADRVLRICTDAGISEASSAS